MPTTAEEIRAAVEQRFAQVEVLHKHVCCASFGVTLSHLAVPNLGISC